MRKAAPLIISSKSNLAEQLLTPRSVLSKTKRQGHGKCVCLVHQEMFLSKRPPRMASAFLGKYASVTVVDLIQLKKLDSRNFYESNLMEARFEII